MRVAFWVHSSSLMPGDDSPLWELTGARLKPRARHWFRSPLWVARTPVFWLSSAAFPGALARSWIWSKVFRTQTRHFSRRCRPSSDSLSRSTIAPTWTKHCYFFILSFLSLQHYSVALFPLQIRFKKTSTSLILAVWLQKNSWDSKHDIFSIIVLDCPPHAYWWLAIHFQTKIPYVYFWLVFNLRTSVKNLVSNCDRCFSRVWFLLEKGLLKFA